MSFSVRIKRFSHHGVECARVEVVLTVTGRTAEVFHRFRFDTGTEITTVSEDVAATLGLPEGGRLVTVSGAAGTADGRLIPVTFRFPSDVNSGAAGVRVSSTWVVVKGPKNVALLGFQEVHRHFSISTVEHDEYVDFVSR